MTSDSLLNRYIRFIDRIGGIRTNLRRAFRPLLERRELARGARTVRFLQGIAPLLEDSKKALRNEYLQYTTSVSNNVFPLSLEVCGFLDAYCRAAQPERILDLGSGFSSYVFRRYQQSSQHGIYVKTVDDSREWLGRTRNYLERHGLPVGAMAHLDDFGVAEDGTFDLVCYDLGDFAMRERFLSRALDAARAGSGVVLLDDCHRDTYRAAIEHELERRGVRPVSLRESTWDGFGRYSWLVTSLGQGASNGIGRTPR